MDNLQVVSIEDFGTKGWMRAGNLEFTRGDALCNLTAQEFLTAHLSLPLGFVNVDGSYIPVAVMGLEAGKNLLVAPDGRWRAPYIPQRYRTYPFFLVENGEERVLCVDQGSNLIREISPDSTYEPFFTDEGEPTEIVQQVLSALNSAAENEVQTRDICDQLEEYGLFEEWPITVILRGRSVKVEGLYRVNEGALNDLTAEKFLALRDSRALLLAYCHLLSLCHIESLVKLANSLEQTGDLPSIEFDLNEDDGGLNFDGL